jgi:hypothetical protein
VVQGLPITTLFNTGVATNDSNGNPATLVAQDSPDPHYNIISSPTGSTGPAVVTIGGQYPFPFWTPDDSDSQWISPEGDEIVIDSPGTYVYQTTFDLTGLSAASTQISGSFWVDNELSAVTLNSTNAGISGGTFDSPTSFMVESGFVAGINVLDFYVLNGPTGGAQNPTGLRVEMSGTASAAFNLTWDNAGASPPADGASWDTVDNNWNNGSAAQTYANGDQVTFNDANNSHYNVTLNTTVSPGTVIVNNNDSNYTIASSTTGANGTPAGLIVANGSFEKNGSGALVLGTGLTAGQLIINQGLVQLQHNTTAGAGNAASNINITSLTITGNGVLDINNNHIIIDYTSSDPIAAITAYIKSGFNQGHWNGPGIISSAAVSPTNGHSYGVGWADGADKIVSGLSSGQIELKYTLLGDANLDGTVNGSDFSILAANFGQGATNWDQGNFLFTPAVNGTDFSALAANFGQGDSGADANVSQADIAALDSFASANGLPLPAIASVPEPAYMGLIAIGAVAPLVRRRKPQRHLER